MHRTFTLLLACLLCTCVRAQVDYFPPENEANWETIAPADLDYDTDSIAALYAFLKDTQTKGFILLKDGRIVLEKYFGTFVQDSVWYWASAGKSLRATLVGIAQEEGDLALTDSTSQYLGTGWTSLTPEREGDITIWHQLTMTSGLTSQQFDCTDPACLRYLVPAGERWSYHNAPYSLTQEVLEAATGLSLNQYTNLKIKKPLGMKNGFWLDRPGGAALFISRVRDAARFGHLILANGQWNGRTILGDTAYLRSMITPSQEHNPAYGYLWWLNGQEFYLEPGDPRPQEGMIAPAAPPDLVLAAGKNGQFVAVSPEKGLVMVRMGNVASDAYAPLEYHNQIWRRLSSLAGTTASREPAVRHLRVFPNPAQDRIWLTLPQQKSYAFSLTDGRGRRCKAGSTNGQLSLAGLPAGIYHLRLAEAGRVWLARIVKR